MNLPSYVQCESSYFVEKSFHMQRVTLVNTLVQFALIDTHLKDSVMEIRTFCIKNCSGI